MRSGRYRGVTVRVAAATVGLLLVAGGGVALSGRVGAEGRSSPRAPVAAHPEAAHPEAAQPAVAVPVAARPPSVQAAAGHTAAPAVPATSAVTRPSASRAPAPAETNGLGPFRRAWVAVPVATLWDQPGTARPVDAPAVSAAPDVARWVATMGYQQKLGLDDLLATQALLDQPLFVYGRDGDWAHVLVLGQTGSVYPWGVAGWMPDGQLTYTAPPAAPTHETVDVPVLAAGGLELSYGTNLPVVARTSGEVTVVLPTGRFAIPSSSLRAGPLPRSGSAVVAQAERFLGLQYLWAGTSSFGYDCSGLTYSVYRSFGITLARDAADQARRGTPVARQDLRPGDLVFFAFDGVIDHVGIYAGNDLMVQAPQTGSAIDVVPMWGTWLSQYYAGARRYL